MSDLRTQQQILALQNTLERLRKADAAMFGIRCRVYNSGSGILTTGAATALGFDSERYDTDGIHSTVSNTSRLTCTRYGLYHITGTVRFAANATGIREISIRVNGATNLAYQDSIVNSAGVDTILTVTTDYELAVGDYVELLAFQNSGGDLNVVASTDFSPVFMMARIA